MKREILKIFVTALILTAVSSSLTEATAQTSSGNPSRNASSDVASLEISDKATGFGPAVSGIRLGEGISRFFALNRVAAENRAAAWRRMYEQSHAEDAFAFDLLNQSSGTSVPISQSFGGTEIVFKRGELRLLAGCDGRIYKIEYKQRDLHNVSSNDVVKTLVSRYGKPGSHGLDRGTGFWLIWNFDQLPSPQVLSASIGDAEWLGPRGNVKLAFNTEGIDGLSAWMDTPSSYGVKLYSKTMGDAARSCFTKNIELQEESSRTKLGF